MSSRVLEESPDGRTRRRDRFRVPPENRFAGLDKRSFVPALVVIGIWVMWVVIVPHIDDAISYDDETQAGEQFALTPDLAFTPPPGWNVVDGLRTTDDPVSGPAGTVVLSSGSVSVVVSADDFSGTPQELLDQINKVTTATGDDESFHTMHQRFNVTTDSGLAGVAEGFATARGQGIIVGFVSDGTGVEVQMVGPVDQMSAGSAEISDMVESIGPWASDGSDGSQEDS